MDSDKFPAYPCLEDETNFKTLFPKNSRPVYVGSLHKDFVKSIVSVKCSSCVKPLIDEESSPMTGYCGHLFCSGCAQKLFDKHNTNWATMNATTEGPVHGLNKEEKEVLFDWCYNGYSLYSCGECYGRNVYARPEEEGAKYLKLFSANIMVENLYKELKKDGFPCGELDCKEWHPKYNSLFCLKCYGDRGKKYQYVCVFESDTVAHAIKHLEHNHKLRIMSPESEDSSYEAEKPPPGTFLSSVERTELRVIASFYHCTHCRKLLEVVNKGKDYTLSMHLECGHFVGFECVKKVLENAGNAHYVACFFCNEKYGKSTTERHFVFPSTQLAGIIRMSPHNLVKCKIGKCGGSLHPRGTNVAKACEWCDVEGIIASRKRLAEE